MKGRDLLLVGGALALGAAIAFPIGLWTAERPDDAPRQEAPPSPAPMRQVFSPKVLSDPYFLDQQRQGVEALERQCRERGDYCAEAAAAREWLQQQAAD